MSILRLILALFKTFIDMVAGPTIMFHVLREHVGCKRLLLTDRQKCRLAVKKTAVRLVFSPPAA